jgi:ABC-type sugar transport system ATPase subunit
VRHCYSTNGQAIYGIDMATGTEGDVVAFPSPDALWRLTFAEVNAWRDRFAAVPFEDHGGTWQGRYYQDIAIARVLAQRARLILADEPVSALDPASAANVLETLRGVARAERIGVLVSLHQVEYARAFADRIVAMAEGRVLFDRAAALLDGAALHAVYGPRALEPA